MPKLRAFRFRPRHPEAAHLLVLEILNANVALAADTQKRVFGGFVRRAPTLVIANVAG